MQGLPQAVYLRCMFPCSHMRVSNVASNTEFCECVDDPPLRLSGGLGKGEGKEEKKLP